MKCGLLFGLPIWRLKPPQPISSAALLSRQRLPLPGSDAIANEPQPCALAALIAQASNLLGTVAVAFLSHQPSSARCSITRGAIPERMIARSSRAAKSSEVSTVVAESFGCRCGAASIAARIRLDIGCPTLRKTRWRKFKDVSPGDKLNKLNPLAATNRAPANGFATVYATLKKIRYFQLRTSGIKETVSVHSTAGESA